MKNSMRVIGVLLFMRVVGLIFIMILFVTRMRAEVVVENLSGIENDEIKVNVFSDPTHMGGQTTQIQPHNMSFNKKNGCFNFKNKSLTGPVELVFSYPSKSGKKEKLSVKKIQPGRALQLTRNNKTGKLIATQSGEAAKACVSTKHRDPAFVT